MPRLPTNKHIHDYFSETIHMSAASAFGSNRLRQTAYRGDFLGRVRRIYAEQSMACWNLGLVLHVLTCFLIHANLSSLKHHIKYAL
jgi:hypothetical protein